VGGTGAITISHAGTITGATFGLTLGGTQGGTLRSILGTTTGTLTKSGSGTWTLSGANTYTGLTTISAGALRATNATALGTIAGGVTVTSGAALELSGGISIGAEALTIRGTGIDSGGALRNISGNNTYAGLITQALDSRINGDADTLTLDVATGNAINGAYSLTFGGSGNVTVNDPIATSTGTLTKSGSGTLTLYGANTYTGTTTISDRKSVV
jgi:autotransporter-associated beta strand protein